jgi:hypothetical protein
MRRLLPLLLLASAPLVGGQQPLTIKRIFSDPPIDGTLQKEVRWHPGGERFSFLETLDEGKDADTPRLAGYQWSPKGMRYCCPAMGSSSSLLTPSEAAGRLEAMTSRQAAGQPANARRSTLRVGGTVPHFAGTPE